jgi:ribosomal protein L22
MQKIKKTCIVNAKNNKNWIANAKSKKKLALPMQKIIKTCIANAKNKKDLHCLCKK